MVQNKKIPYAELINDLISSLELGNLARDTGSSWLMRRRVSVGASTSISPVNLLCNLTRISQRFAV